MTEIVYGHLFAAIEHDRNLRQLRRVAETAARLGVRLPDATFLAGTAVAVDGYNGWGAPLSGHALEELRAISDE